MLVANCCRYVDAAGFGKSFEPCRYIHTIAVDVVTFDDDVAKIHLHAKRDPLSFVRLPIAFGHASLHRDGASNGFDNARELDQNAVAGRFDDAAFVLGDFGVDEFTTMGSEAVPGSSLVLPMRRL